MSKIYQIVTGPQNRLRYEGSHINPRYWCGDCDREIGTPMAHHCNDSIWPGGLIIHRAEIERRRAAAKSRELFGRDVDRAAR